MWPGDKMCAPISQFFSCRWMSILAFFIIFVTYKIWSNKNMKAKSNEKELQKVLSLLFWGSFALMKYCIK